MALPSSHTSLKKLMPKEKKYLQKRSLQRTYSMPQVQWTGRSPSATARSTAGGTQGCLDLERNLLDTRVWLHVHPIFKSGSGVERCKIK